MNSILEQDIRDILLAINTNTKLSIQIVTTISYRIKSKQLATKYGIEYLKKIKYYDENTKKNKYKNIVSKNELIKTKLGLLKRLGEIYQEQVEKEKTKEEQRKNKKRSEGGDD